MVVRTLHMLQKLTSWQVRQLKKLNLARESALSPIAKTGLLYRTFSTNSAKSQSEQGCRFAALLYLKLHLIRKSPFYTPKARNH